MRNKTQWDGSLLRTQFKPEILNRGCSFAFFVNAIEVSTLSLTTANNSPPCQFSRGGCHDSPLTVSGMIITTDHTPVMRRSHFVSVCSVGKLSCVMPVATMCVQNWQPCLAFRIHSLWRNHDQLPLTRQLSIFAVNIQQLSNWWFFDSQLRISGFRRFTSVCAAPRYALPRNGFTCCVSSRSATSSMALAIAALLIGTVSADP